MGSVIVSICANTDFFQKLVQKYGEMFIKLIVSEKMKMELEQNFPIIIAKLKEYVQSFVRKIDEIVDGKIRQLTLKFQQLKQYINQMFPGRIQELEQKKRMSINQLTGFDDFLFKIDEVRDKSIEEINQQHVELEKELHVKKTEIYNEIEKQRPKVPLYESLEDETRFKVLRKAQVEFAQKIEEGKQKIQERCENSLGQNLYKMNGTFDRINPNNFLQDFIRKSADEMLYRVTGNNNAGCGKFGGCLFDML